MATNVLNGNTYYVTTASSSSSEALIQDDVQLLGIIYTSATANQTFVLNDVSNQSTAGTIKFKGSLATAYDTLFIRLADSPIRFTKGIWISTLDSGSLTLIVKLK